MQTTAHIEMFTREAVHAARREDERATNLESAARSAVTMARVAAALHMAGHAEHMHAAALDATRTTATFDGGDA